MELSADRKADVTVVTVVGSVDSADSDDLRSFIDNLIEAGQVHLVLDLTNMDFIVSMGLGILVQTYTRLRQDKGSLRLASPQSHIVRLIKTTGLDRLLPIYDSLDQALE